VAKLVFALVGPAAALAFPFIRAMMQVLSSFDAFLIL
jgi:hypothetical protein